MKETRNASLASQSFTFDEDAYVALKEYLDDISSRLPEMDRETMEDVEYRLAEILREKLTSPMMVLTLRHVREAMSQMGRPSDFGERRREQTIEEPIKSSRALRRSRSNRSIAGICGGIGSYFDIDATLVRLIAIFMLLFGGLSIWVYVILWIVIPEEPASAPLSQNK